MNLHKIWQIARREFLINIRRRAFLFTLFGLPALTIGVTFVVMALVAQQISDTSMYKRVGVVDKANVFADNSKLGTPFVLIDSEDTGLAEVKAATMEGYFVLREDFPKTGHIEMYSRPQLGLSEGLQEKLEDDVKSALAASVDDPALAMRLREPVDDLAIYRIGTNERLQSYVLFASFMVPFVLGFLIFIASSTTSQFLMSGLVEEKENRMLELFVTSARTSEILWGKLIGLGALGLTQIAVWAVIAFIAASTRNDIDVGNLLASLQITPGYLLLILLFFMLGYLFNGALLFSIGALVNAEQESRQIGGFISFLSVLPFVLLAFIITEPNGTFSKILSFLPLTAPVGMLLRMSWADVQAWEIVLSLVLLVLSTFGLIWAAAKIFRLGMLNYGKRLGLRDIVRSLRGASV